MKILDGKSCAQKIKGDLQKQVNLFLQMGYRRPHLGIILVGQAGASVTYVNNKCKDCDEVGIDYTLVHFEEQISEDSIIQQISSWNEDQGIDGYIVQLPLPEHINEQHVIETIKPSKDVDGFTPTNIGLLGMDDKENGYISATPLGVLSLLSEYGISTKGMNCVIIGRSKIVGRPLANLLSAKGRDCTVTMCHSLTKNISSLTKMADIIITAMGVPHFLKADMINEGAVVIDVGITRVPADNEKGYIITGDVDFDDVAPKCSFITPVPGGVGPMTIVALLQNTIKSYKRNNNL